MDLFHILPFIPLVLIISARVGLMGKKVRSRINSWKCLKAWLVFRAFLGLVYLAYGYYFASGFFR